MKRQPGWRSVGLVVAVLTFSLMSLAVEAGDRRSSSSGGDRGKSTASRGSSSGSSSSRSSAQNSRGSRASARKSSAPRASATATTDRAGSSRVAVRGTGAGTQVALGRSTYGRYYGSSYGVPYYHYRPYYSYPSWWVGSYGWAYYDSPGVFFASVGWPYAWSNYCWPAYYNAWAFSGDGSLPDDHGNGQVDAYGARVALEIEPKKASVILNGDDIGQARDYNGRWDELYLEPGVHRIEFAAPGYQTYRVYLEVRQGRDYRIAERLAHGEGLDSRSMEEPKRETPIRPVEEPSLDDQDRREALDRADLRQPRVKRDRIDLDDFEPPQLDSQMLKQGLLRIDVFPDDAAVYLDGKFLARAGELSRLHGALPIAGGAHSLKIVHPDYRTEALTVDIEPGTEPTEVNVRLERN